MVDIPMGHLIQSDLKSKWSSFALTQLPINLLQAINSITMLWQSGSRRICNEWGYLPQFGTMPLRAGKVRHRASPFPSSTSQLITNHKSSRNARPLFSSKVSHN
jgi:hypothetical protein